MTMPSDMKRLEKMLDQRKAIRFRTLGMWSDSGERLPYNPVWTEDASDNSHNATGSVPNFAGHSSLGSGEWFVPWRIRWSRIA